MPTDRLFHEIASAQVVLVASGVYQQAKLYRRFDGIEHQIFAKRGAGFVRLLGSGGTSVPSVRWLDMDPAGWAFKTGKLGAPVYEA